jgi:hypothetical protein
MRRVVYLIPLAILAMLLAAWWMTNPARRQQAGAESRDASAEISTADAPRPNDVPAPDASPVVSTAPSAQAAAAPPARVQQAYRFVLSDGRIELEAAEELRGDFHTRRGGMEWRPGMYYFRLLDGASNVLAEQTLPAPDQQCVVLDPNTPDAKGAPRPAVLTATGPVVFQVRMPKVEGATQMRVYRLGSTRRALKTEEPLGQFLASIPLAP